MRKFIVGLVTVAVLLLACETCDSPTSPPVEPPTTTTTVEPTKPPRVDAEFTWDGMAGFSLFAGLRLTEEEIHIAYNQAFAAGRNTARVCAETEFWPDNALLPRVPRDLDNLNRFLDVVARIQGAQVLLMNNCTLKHGDGISGMDQTVWNFAVTKTVVGWKCSDDYQTCYPRDEAVEPYRNVAIEVVNEPWHWKHYYYHKDGEVRALLRNARNAAEGHQVGADDHFCAHTDSYRHYLSGHIDFASFHPCRDAYNKPWDPSKKILKRLVNANGGLAVLSETVAWDDNGDQCEHFLRTCDKNRILDYERDCSEVPGCRFVFHSEDGLSATVPFSWMPQAPR